VLRSNLTRPQLFGFGFAAVSLALAACSHGGSTPSAVTTPSPVPTGSVTVLSSPCAAAYVAYEPDAGVANGAGFRGLQTVHYEDGNTNLCGYTTAVATPVPVAFSSSVQSLAFSSDFSDAVALIEGGRAASAGGYGLVQDIFGVSVGQIVPAGSPYDLTIQPTAVPTIAPSPGSSPAPTASATGPAETLTDASSIAVFGSSTTGIALTTGPAATSIIGVTSLTNAPPEYGSAVTYVNSNYPIKVANVPRSILAVAGNGTALLARGPNDLLSFAITSQSSGYQLSAEAEDMSLGSNVTLRGVGNVVFDPADATRALVAGSSSGQSNLLTLVTGLPSAITHTSHIFLPASINSMTIDASGTYAYVATPVGIYSVSGINSSVLAQAVAFTTRAAGPSVLSYTNCNKVAALLTNVSSVRLSSDGKFLVALGNAPNTVCPIAGFNSSVVAVPINPAADTTPSPGPTAAATASATATPFITKFVQNNVITPPSAADYFLVR
jgi:hypothetical protein